MSAVAAAAATTPRSCCPECGEQLFRPSRSGRGFIVKNRFLIYEPTRSGGLIATIGCSKCGATLRVRKSGGLLLLFARARP